MEISELNVFKDVPAIVRERATQATATLGDSNERRRTLFRKPEYAGANAVSTRSAPRMGRSVAGLDTGRGGIVMAWPVDAPVYNFNSFSIAVNSVAECGVYALFDGSKRLLAIDSGEVQGDLLRLAERADRDLLEAGPEYFSFVLAPLEQCEALKRRLIYPDAPWAPPIQAMWSAPRT